MQAPALHVVPPVQMFPQAPQFVALESTSVSQPAAIVQSRKPALHAKPQLPEVHAGLACATAGQTTPQALQLAGSNDRFVQVPPQFVVPPTQVSTHELVATLQTWPPVQVVVPASQRSVASLHVSVPLQLTASAQPRALPAPQTAAAEHVSPVVQ